MVTNSYHGTIFAIIFKKPFYTLINNNRGEARFYSLLSKLNLLDRIVVSLPEKFEEINWTDLDSRLGELKYRSIEFLKNALR